MLGGKTFPDAPNVFWPSDLDLRVYVLVSKSTFRFLKLMITLILTEVLLSYLVYMFVSTTPHYKGPHSIRRAMLSSGNSCWFNLL